MKKGKPVRTRDGRPARILCYDFISIDNTPIIALVKLSEKQEAALFYNLDGKEGNSDLDLMMEGEKRKMYVNVYKAGPDGSRRMLGGLLSTTEEAVKEVIIDQELYIATVPVEWEE